ncbi:MAG TPA: cyclic dehypoxanthinyl futalosine synthase [Candidatus Eisenbacteria bacterium]|nr:cyclic dehypoxanthinyl futalosine synthase [Candidatus Eisenbacteria bacterium]
MPRLRLGSIEFINSLPVDLGLGGASPLDAEIVRGTPSALNDLMLAGSLDVSAVSAFWFARHAADLVLLPGLSISSESGVQSVLLFSRHPWKELKGTRITVTGKGRTTPALLEILCRFRYDFTPKVDYSPSALEDVVKGRASAALLIGDEALTARRRFAGDEALRVYDLAEEWKDWTGLPLVFAVWTARRAYFNEHPSRVREAHEALLVSKRWGLENPEAILDAAEARSGLPRETLRSYFSGLSYGLGEPLRKGMLLYFDYAKKAGLLDRTPAILELPTASAAPSPAATAAPVAGGSVESILAKALAGGRVTVEEGVKLYHEANLFELGAAASELCLRKNPGSDKKATFVVDRNINYTNICYTYCKFCAFYREPGDVKEGYLRSTQEIFDKIAELVAIGGTQVLLQGGHNPQLGIEYYEDIVRRIRAKFPQVHVHSFSASETQHISRVSKISIREVLERLKAAGLNSLPGGGAEILVDRVRQAVSPLKTKTAEYFEVHRTAHELGLKSTSTMVYGLGETIEERMMHLDAYRTQQDKTGGFRAFIPWSFESESTEMKMPRRTGSEYLRMIALCRIMLDNIQHLQAGWVTEGPKLSQVALDFGADDFGGILMEENVVSATKSDKLYAGVTKEEAIRLIAETGKTPVQRNTNYETVKVHQADTQLVAG